MTLIEVMVTGVVLGIFSTMITHAVVVAYKAQSSSQEKVTALREASLTLDWLRRELSTSSSLLGPDPNASLSGWTPTQGDPLRFARNSDTGTVEVWYWYDSSAEEVRRWQQGEPPEGRVVAREVKAFSINHSGGSPVLTANMRVSTIAKPLTAVARMLSL